MARHLPFVLWLAGLIAFAVAAAFAASNDRFPGDLWLTREIQGIEGESFDRLLDWTEDFADWPLLAVVIAGGSIVLLFTAGPEPAALLALSTLARLINSGVKELVERPRPTADVVDVTCLPNSTFSFPSGHSDGAFVLFGLILYFAAVYLRDARLRVPLQAACVWIIVFTGVERVYAGCHWPSDVLGGYFAGVLMVAIFIALHRLVISRRTR